MFRNTILFVAPAALCIVVANATRTHQSAAYAVLIALAITLIVAIVAEIVFHRRGIRFWSSWAFAGGVCGAILCLLNLVLFRKDGVDAFLGIVAAVTLVCFLFPVRSRGLSMIRGIFIPIALANGALLLWLCVLMAANLPWFYPPALLEANYPQRTNRQARDMETLAHLLPRTSDPENQQGIDPDLLGNAEAQIREKFPTQGVWLSLAGVDLALIGEDLRAVEPALDQIWSFLSSHQPVYEFKIESSFPSPLSLRRATILEVLAIQLEAQQGKNFRPRLLRFFRAIRTWMNVDAGLLTARFGSLAMVLGCDSLMPLAEHLAQPDPELLELLRTTRETLLPAYRKGLLLESLALRESINYPSPEPGTTERFMKLVTGGAFAEDSLQSMTQLLDSRRRHWPFYNERDTVKIINDNLSADLAAVDAPDHLSRVERFGQRSEAIEQMAASRSHLVNPGGRFRLNAFVPNNSGSYLYLAFAQARLAAFEQLLMNKWGISSPPILNPVTGKPFEVAPDGSIAITASFSKWDMEHIKRVYPLADQPVSL